MAIIMYAHFQPCEESAYRQLFGEMANLTPVVQALPPCSALLDLSGAIRYFGLHPIDLAELLRLRALMKFAATATLGIGPNRMLATLAAQTTMPGSIRVLTDSPEQISEFLGPLPVQALPDIGPKTARTLAKYGLTTVADLRTVPMATLQRLTSTGTGRLLADRARGHDPRTVQPGGPPASLSARRDFARDTLGSPARGSGRHSAGRRDTGRHGSGTHSTGPHGTDALGPDDPVRRALLSCALELAARLRAGGQVAGRLEVEIRFADRSATSRSRTLREATDHTSTLQSQVYELYDSLGLQRARLRALTVRAQGLRPVESATVQLTFDHRAELGRRLDPVMDRAADRFGPGALTRAALLRR